MMSTPGGSRDIVPPPGLNRNLTSYPTLLAERIRNVYEKYEGMRTNVDSSDAAMARVLKFYQYLCRDLITDPDFGFGVGDNARGLLIDHDMGMGKTHILVAVAMAVAEFRPVIAVIPKSLHANVPKTVRSVIRGLMRAEAAIAAERGAAGAADAPGTAGSASGGAAVTKTVARVKIADETEAVADETEAVADVKLVKVADDRTGDNAPPADKRDADGAVGAKDEIEVEVEARATEIDKIFNFVSMDAYNMAKQAQKAAAAAWAPRAADDWYGTLDGKLLIVDEAHNFFRSIINGAKNAHALYVMIQKARNLRILFLTGTPITKNPFEIVPCFNMLAGRELLPTQYMAFTEFFVDEERRMVKNRGVLANRLLGMVSHASVHVPVIPARRAGAPGAASAGSTSGAVPRLDELRVDGGFPEVFDTELVEVEMSPRQYKRYLVAREAENVEGGGSGGAPPEMGDARARAARLPALTLPGSERGGGSTYYVRSRMLSNFAPMVMDLSDEDKKVLSSLTDSKTTSDDKSRAFRAMFPDVGSLDDREFTTETSPKAAVLVDQIVKSPGPAIVYSQFVGYGGGAVARFLQRRGFKRLVMSAGTSFPSTKEKRFAVIHGEVPADERNAVAVLMSDVRNIRGEYALVLIISKTGVEGLDLKNFRQTHQVEPYWDVSRASQFKARAARMGSHDALPRASRDVRPFLYVAVANARVHAGIPPDLLLEPRTIDEEFLARGIKQDELNQDFRRLIRSVAIECVVNGFPANITGSAGCRTCMPTGAPLFTKNVAHDLDVPDPCRAVSEEAVETEKIEIGAEDDRRTFFFRANADAPTGYDVFVFDEAIGSHRALLAGDPVIEEVVAAIALRSAARGVDRGQKLPLEFEQLMAGLGLDGGDDTNERDET